MDEPCQSDYNVKFSENNYDYYNRQYNLYRDGFLNDDHKLINTGENLNSNELPEKSDINNNNIINYQLGFYNLSPNSNEDYLNMDNDNFNRIINNGEVNYNPEILPDSKNIELDQNKKTTCHMDKVNGKQIIMTNEMVSNKLTELFKTNQINIETLKEMQMLKKKKRRRTNAEIELDKKLEPEVKIEKKRGRQKKGLKIVEKLVIKHPKDADDNMAKKINTYYIEQIRSWTNKSFLDKNMNFISDKLLKKKKDNYFYKLLPSLITTKINKESIIDLMEKKFKDIFYSYPVSKKYKSDKDHNKNLVDKIYSENDQPFVIFILEMTFIEGLNFFNGQITDEYIINYFKNNYSFNEELILKFVQNFKKIGTFLDKLHKDNKGQINDNDLQNYIQKISVLCLNFENSFKNKYKRKESSKNKIVESEIK